MIMGSVGEELGQSLSAGVLNQPDPEIVRDGLPAYLLLIDGLIVQSPESAGLLQVGASLHSAYAGQFVDDEGRQKIQSAIGLNYALKLSCLEIKSTCAIRDIPFEKLQPVLNSIEEADISSLYVLGTSWAGWLQARAGNWDAITDMPRIQAVLQRVIELDETYHNGSAHLYLGVMASLVPPAMGGRPEVAEQHFRRAITLSGEQNLIANVLFARYYARLVFDKALHDQLLRDVLSADPVVDGLTLSNTLAQQQARALLAGSDDFF